MIKYTPKETRGSIARMAHLSEFQLTVARTVVTACSILCGFISVNPIPGLGIPAVMAIQSFMVTYIAWIKGKEFSEQSRKDTVVAASAIAATDAALKFVPAFGSLISAGTTYAATQALGDSTISYFFSNEENECI